MRFLLAGFLWALFVSNICAGDTATSPASGASNTDEQRPPVFQLTIRPSSAEKHSIQTTGGGRDAIGNPVKYNRTETGFTLPELVSSIYSERGPHFLIESPLPEGRFDISINSTSGGRLQIGSLQALRRTAIEAAFGLTAEHETHNLEAYALTVKDKEANGLRPTKGPANSGEAGGVGYLSGSNRKIDALVKRLELLLNHPVVDETGLIGNFDYHLEWGPKSAADEPTSSRLINAVRDQLGLELKLAKRPVDVLVIRRIDTAQRAQANSDAR
jgi:uncharacterized protein (TIGR03435 family)